MSQLNCNSEQNCHPEQNCHSDFSSRHSERSEESHPNSKQTEHFSSTREFNNKFPSKLYICCFCNKITNNPNQCPYCNGSTNTLFPLDTYTYKIDNQEEKTIFKPLELVNPILAIVESKGENYGTK